jgi:hypothetical protein
MSVQHEMAASVDATGHTSDRECWCRPAALCARCRRPLPCRHALQAKVGDVLQLLFIHQDRPSRRVA